MSVCSSEVVPLEEKSQSNCLASLPSSARRLREENTGITKGFMALMQTYLFPVNGLSEARVLLNFHFALFCEKCGRHFP